MAEVIEFPKQEAKKLIRAVLKCSGCDCTEFLVLFEDDGANLYCNGCGYIIENYRVIKDERGI